MSDKNPNAKAIFGKALEIDSVEARLAYLDEACQADQQLRSEVDALLQAIDEAGSFMARPIMELEATIEQRITEGPGTQIGPYKLLQKVGEGGMGVVYMAEQKEPVKRRVALKIIKPGMDTQQVIARFEAERQALAMMDHPNIAKVLDAAATESGRPYFVMELVNGIPLSKYCDEQHLTPKERLELFVPICEAIQHAHQKGIIHRDLKPSNVLVALYDGRPVPKVIDFGVAKATNQSLTEKTLFTQLGQIVGTMEYMSPEQAERNQLDIDTRSDIYSLGVMLYELLTGETPFDRQRLKSAAFDEVLRIIREEEPPRPSTKLSTIETLPSVAANRRVEPAKLSMLVRGELDWIVMKALEKDRARRYETADSFAADIQRYLHDEPVMACPPSAAYQFSKFARRNKAALVTAALVGIAVVCGLAGTTWQAIRANQERHAADAERKEATDAKELADQRLQRALKAERTAQESAIVEVGLRQVAQARSKEVTDLLARSYVDHAQSLCDQGDIGRGIVWYARSLEAFAPDADKLDQVVRMNLASWRRQLHALEEVLLAEAEVRCVGISPDGSRLLTGSRDGAVRIWNAKNGESMGTLLGHTTPIRAIAISPDGTRIGTASNDAGVRLWDAATRQLVSELPPGRYKEVALAFQPDSELLIVARGGKVDGYDVVDGHLAKTLFEVEPPGSGEIRALSYSSAGLRAVVSSGRESHQLWDLPHQRVVGPPVEHDSVLAVSIHPDGKRFATAGYHNMVRLWNGSNGELAIEPMKHGGVIQTLCFNSDGSRLLSGANDRAARIWDVETGRAVGVPMRHRGTVHDVAFSSDGERLLSGSQDGTARLWRIASGTTTGRQITHSEQVVAAAFGADGLRILTKRQGQLCVRDGETGEPIGQPLEPARRQPFQLETYTTLGNPVFSSDASRVATKFSGGGNVWEVGSGRRVQEFAFRVAAFSPDSARLLTGGQNGVVGLADAYTNAPLGKLPRQPNVVSTVGFMPDGARFMTGCFDGTIQLWDAETLEAAGPAMSYPSEVKTATISPDGSKILAGYADWTARVWDTETGNPVGIPLHHRHFVCSTAFSPDGSRMATCAIDGEVRFWDSETRIPVGPALRHTGGWPAVSFSPDGAQLLTAVTGSNFLWEAPTNRLHGSLEQVLLWAQVTTGLQLDESGGITVLDGLSWRDRREKLERNGGWPISTPLPQRATQRDVSYSAAMKLALRGRQYMAAGHWESALADFQTAIDRSNASCPLRLQIAYWIGALATKGTAYEEGCEQLIRYSIALLEGLDREFTDHPRYPDLRSRLESQYVKLAHYLSRVGHKSASLEVERQLLALLPNGWKQRLEAAQKRANAANWLHGKGYYQAREEQLTIVTLLVNSVINEIEKQPQHRGQLQHAYKVLGERYALGGPDKMAVVCLRQLLRLQPEDARGNYLLATVLLESSDPEVYDPEQAVRYARVAADKAQTVRRYLAGLYLGTLGRALYRTGDIEGAAEVLLKKESIAPWAKPVDPQSKLCLAMAHWQLGNEEAARRVYQSAIDRPARVLVSNLWHQASQHTLQRFASVLDARAEAAQLLGLTSEVEAAERRASTFRDLYGCEPNCRERPKLK